MINSEHHIQFFTATILEWKHLLKDDKYKNIILNSLRFLVKEQRVIVNSFAIMSNHLHLIWQAINGFTPQQVQQSFLKYTAQQIKFDLQKNDQQLLEEFRVNAKDRTYQFWERNSLSIDLYSEEVYLQKENYIHYNPVEAGLCKFPEEYYYSSARFYETLVDGFGFSYALAGLEITTLMHVSLVKNTQRRRTVLRLLALCNVQQSQHQQRQK